MKKLSLTLKLESLRSHEDNIKRYSEELSLSIRSVRASTTKVGVIAWAIGTEINNAKTHLTKTGNFQEWLRTQVDIIGVSPGTLSKWRAFATKFPTFSDITPEQFNNYSKALLSLTTSSPPLRLNHKPHHLSIITKFLEFREQWVTGNIRVSPTDVIADLKPLVDWYNNLLTKETSQI